MKLLLTLILTLVALAVLLLLSWNDVLPGSWRLQGWVLGVEGRDNRVRLQHRAERIELFRREQDQVPAGAILFLGSSTMERFPLDRIFPNKPCVNRGINGAGIGDLLERLDVSLPRTTPGGLVIAIGGNDLRRLAMSGEEAARSAARLMAELRKRYPQVPMVWLGLFGESQAPGQELAEAELYNQRVSAEARSQDIRFLPTQREPLIGPDGRLLPSHASDRYHLNHEGYLQLGRWIAEEGGELGQILQP